MFGDLAIPEKPLKQSIREFEAADVDFMINYFLQADPAFLELMGVEPGKLPRADAWRRIVLEDLERPLEHRKFYYLLWQIDGAPVGQSNINKIVYGKEAYMHLHLWGQEQRQRGHGTYFIRKSISRYFEKFQLQNLYCEPYALNQAPNKTLPKAGFEFIETYETTPGWINFKQRVNRWVLSREKWLQQSQ